MIINQGKSFWNMKHSVLIYHHLAQIVTFSLRMKLKLEPKARYSTFVKAMQVKKWQKKNKRALNTAWDKEETKDLKYVLIFFVV